METETVEVKEEAKELIKEGDLFYTSWGYDQTQYNFLKVIAISPSGKTAKCQMVRVRVVEQLTQAYGERVEPTNETYGDVFTMIIQKDNQHLRGSYPYCEGDKRLDTFWKLTNEDKIFVNTER